MTRIATSFLWLSFFIVTAPVLAEGSPRTVRYEGFLTNAQGEPVDCPTPQACGQPISVTLQLYAAPEGGTPVWTETLDSVPVNNGVLSLDVGATVPLPARELGAEVYLSVNINGAGELLPRQRVTAALFALRAAEADYAQEAGSLRGIAAEDFPTLDDVLDVCLTPDALAAQLEERGVVNEAALSAVAKSGDYRDLSNVPPPFSGRFDDLEGIPPGLLDSAASGIAMSCTEGAILRFDGAAGAWVCSADTDTDTKLSEAEVDAYVGNNGYAADADLKAVAKSGSYADLVNKPELQPVALSGSYYDLINKPSLQPVALSGNYNDLNNRPQWFSGNFGDLIGTPGVLNELSLDADGQLTFAGIPVIDDTGVWVGPTTGLQGPQGDTGPQGPEGLEGAQGAAGVNGLMDVLSEPAGNTCSEGGIRIRAGQDLNNNQILETAEVLTSGVVCNGAAGASGDGAGNYDLPKYAWSPPQPCTVTILQGTYFDTTLGVNRVCDGQFWVPESETCGDGVVNDGEECDDRNDDTFDSCARCTRLSQADCLQDCDATGAIRGMGQTLLEDDAGAPGDQMGGTVASVGNIIAVGAPRDDGIGSVLIYEKVGSQWAFKQKIQPFDGVNGDSFGASLAMDETSLFIGVTGDDDYGEDSGSIYRYDYNIDSEQWVYQGKLSSPGLAAGDWLGANLDLDGDTLAAGAPGDDDMGSNSGSITIFTRQGGSWSFQQRLVPPTALTNQYWGGSFKNSASLFSGTSYVKSIALSGNLLVVTNLWANSSRGAMYIFRRGGTWTLEQTIIGNSSLQIAAAVEIEGETIAVAGRESNTERFDIYGLQNGTWVLSPRPPQPPSVRALVLQGDRLVVGAGSDDVRNTDAGSVYLYQRIDDLWYLLGSYYRDQGQAYDYLASSVALVGERIVAGVPYIDRGPYAEYGGVVVFETGSLCATEGNCVCRFGYGESDCSTLLAP